MTRDGTKDSLTYAATVPSAQPSVSSALQGPHHSAVKSYRIGFPEARAAWAASVALIQCTRPVPEPAFPLDVTAVTTRKSAAARSSQRRIGEIFDWDRGGRVAGGGAGSGLETGDVSVVSIGQL